MGALSVKSSRVCAAVKLTQTAAESRREERLGASKAAFERWQEVPRASIALAWGAKRLSQ